MIDVHGFRANVGIAVTNDDGQLLWARCRGKSIWQLPQGGIDGGETPEEAMYRELYEELGLLPEHICIMARTTNWLRYRLPRSRIRRHMHPHCIGQKQIWFLLRLQGAEAHIRLDAYDKPEFDDWRWVDYRYPENRIVYFKAAVYRAMLDVFADWHDQDPPDRVQLLNIL